MQRLHSWPGREAASCGAEGDWPCEHQGPFRHGGKGTREGPEARPPNPSHRDRPISDFVRPPRVATAMPRGRRDVARGSSNGETAARRDEQRELPSFTALSIPRAIPVSCSAEPGHAEKGAAGPRNPGPTAFPAVPSPLRPVSLAAPGHAARSAGAGSLPASSPAPLPLGTQLIGQTGEPPQP